MAHDSRHGLQPAVWLGCDCARTMALRDADWCQRFHGPKIAEALERGSAVASSRPRIPSRGSSKAEALCSELSERGSGDTEQAAVQIAGASLTLWPSGSFEIPSPGCRTQSFGKYSSTRVLEGARHGACVCEQRGRADERKVVGRKSEGAMWPGLWA